MRMDDSSSGASRIGLVLGGGGARAAYQAGVLRAIAHLLPRDASNPFPVISGTSAGAINAVALASNAANFRAGVRRMVLIWRNLHAHQVYRSDLPGVAKSGARWLAAMMFGLGGNRPISLLDNSPLRSLLAEHVDFGTIDDCVAAGHLDAISVTASGYTSGQSVTFYQGLDSLRPWKRARRLGFPAKLGIPHLMASSAIPFVFPAVHINREYFGDGSMRQIAPISPALHLGADRVLIITAGRMAREQPERVKTTGYPSLAQIAGHALASIFLDTLESDIERLERVNRTLSLLPPEMLASEQLPLRRIEHLVISPSEEIEPIAQRYAHELPRTIRFFLRGLGVKKRSGANLVSYLLFERAYCRALIALGYKDTMRRRDEVQGFFGVTRRNVVQAVDAELEP
jgi:NTE family protein